MNNVLSFKTINMLPSLDEFLLSQIKRLIINDLHLAENVKFEAKSLYTQNENTKNNVYKLGFSDSDMNTYETILNFAVDINKPTIIGLVQENSVPHHKDNVLFEFIKSELYRLCNLVSNNRQFQLLLPVKLTSTTGDSETQSSEFVIWFTDNVTNYQAIVSTKTTVEELKVIEANKAGRKAGCYQECKAEQGWGSKTRIALGLASAAALASVATCILCSYPCGSNCHHREKSTYCSTCSSTSTTDSTTSSTTSSTSSSSTSTSDSSSSSTTSTSDSSSSTSTSTSDSSSSSSSSDSSSTCLSRSAWLRKHNRHRSSSSCSSSCSSSSSSCSSYSGSSSSSCSARSAWLRRHNRRNSRNKFNRNHRFNRNSRNKFHRRNSFNQNNWNNLNNCNQNNLIRNNSIRNNCNENGFNQWDGPNWNRRHRRRNHRSCSRSSSSQSCCSIIIKSISKRHCFRGGLRGGMHETQWTRKRADTGRRLGKSKQNTEHIAQQAENLGLLLNKHS